MEENNNAPNKPETAGEKQPESKKFLVFYVIGLFCVALALILLSYVAQVRSDRRLSELTNQLSTQTSAAEGANARVQVLQQSVEEQSKILDDLMQHFFPFFIVHHIGDRCLGEPAGPGNILGSDILFPGTHGAGSFLRENTHK